MRSQPSFSGLQHLKEAKLPTCAQGIFEAMFTRIIRARSDRVSAMQLNSFWPASAVQSTSFFMGAVCFHVCIVYFWADVNIQLYIIASVLTLSTC